MADNVTNSQGNVIATSERDLGDGQGTRHFQMAQMVIKDGASLAKVEAGVAGGGVPVVIYDASGAPVSSNAALQGGVTTPSTDVVVPVAARRTDDPRLGAGVDANGKLTWLEVDNHGRLRTIGGTDKITLSAGAGQTIAANEGDYLERIECFPSAVSGLGNITVYDSAVEVFTFVASGITFPDTRPVTLPVGGYSSSAAWTIDVGTGWQVVAWGNFGLLV